MDNEGSLLRMDLEIEAGLVTGSDEVIKTILREIYRKFNVMLRPKQPENRFIL
jgi:phosphatidylinositol-4,5-bisphosphate 3-kinase